MALNPFLIFYSTEARAYSLMLVLGLLSTLALVRALDTAAVRWWAAYAAFSCAALYTHYTVVFVLLAQLAWAFWTRPGARRALLAANAAAALGFLPWLSEFLADSRSPCSKTIGILQPFGLDTVRLDLGRWSIGHPFISIASLPGHVAVAMLGAGLAVAIVGLALHLRAVPTRGRVALPARPALVLALALATPVGEVFYSLVGNSVFTARNLIASSPGLALATAGLIAGSGRLRLVAATLVLTGFTIGSVQMLSVRSQRPDYLAAARYIERVGAPGDPVVDMPFPTPGPLTALRVAFARAGISATGRHPLLNLGYPSLATLMQARAPGGVGACASGFLPGPPPEAIARQASKLGSGHAIFLVTLGSGSFAEVRALAGSQQAAFVRALPTRFQYSEARRFPGLSGMDVSVYVIRG